MIARPLLASRMYLGLRSEILTLCGAASKVFAAVSGSGALIVVSRRRMKTLFLAVLPRGFQQPSQ